MADLPEHFEKIRVALLAADEALAEALDARASAVKAMVELRAEYPDSYYNWPRDEDALLAVAAAVRQFPSEAARHVMAEVLSGSKSLVAPVSVAYAGHEGSFAHLAARLHFGGAASLRPAMSAEQVLSEIESGRCTFGVLPFETPHDGAVTLTLNALSRGDAKISAEVQLRRNFNLLSPAGELARVRRVYGATQALDACASYLQRKLPDAVLIDVRGGLAAARRAEQDDEGAALATAVVSELCQLKTIEEHVEDASDLRTRFVVVGHDYPPRSGRDRTAVAVALNDAPGVLMQCLQPFAERKINVDRVETRPARGWDFRYLILLEVTGHVTDRAVLSAIEELRTRSPYIRVLGSYPHSDAA